VRGDARLKALQKPETGDVIVQNVQISLIRSKLHAKTIPFDRFWPIRNQAIVNLASKHTNRGRVLNPRGNANGTSGCHEEEEFGWEDT
jgi:hypothetical protein